MIQFPFLQVIRSVSSQGLETEGGVIWVCPILADEAIEIAEYTEEVVEQLSTSHLKLILGESLLT